MIVATDCNFSMAVAYHAVELADPGVVIMRRTAHPSAPAHVQRLRARWLFPTAARPETHQPRQTPGRENGYLSGGVSPDHLHMHS